MKWSWALPALGAIGALAHPGRFSDKISQRDCDEDSTSASPIYLQPSEVNTSASPTASPTSEYTAPPSMKTLLPAIPDDHDMNNLKHLTPHKRGSGAAMHYSHGRLGSGGTYLVATPRLTAPSVVLDHSGRISVVYVDGSLIISFSDQNAFDHSSSKWPSKDIIFITFTAVCDDYYLGQRCYFHATEIIFDPETLTVTVLGYSRPLHHIVNDIDVVWGSFGTQTAGGPTTSTFSAESSAQTQTQLQTVTRTPTCLATPDTKYSLPTACPGPDFDDELDNELGFLGEDDFDFNETLHNTDVDENKLYSNGTSGVGKRWISLAGAWSSVKGVIEAAAKVQEAVRKFSTDTAQVVVSTIQTTAKIATNILAGRPNVFENDIERLILPLPKQDCAKVPNTPNGRVNACKPANGTRVADSPWGDEAVLLYAVGQAPTREKIKPAPGSKWQGELTKGAFMNIYCVKCGLTGSLKSRGNITIARNGAITQGNFSAMLDLTVGLGLGIHAKYVNQQVFRKDLYSVPVTPFTVGFVSVGPFVSLGAEATFALTMEGSMQARADVSIARANFTWDFKAGSATNYSFKPEFRPSFEAEGSVVASAQLALPIGIRFGITTFGNARLEGSIGIDVKPSVKIASGIGASLATDGTANGTESEALNDCIGVSTQLSVRNKVAASIRGFGFKGYKAPIHDTKDYVLASYCLGKEVEDDPEEEEDDDEDDPDLTSEVYDLTEYVKEDDLDAGFERPNDPTIPFNIDPTVFDGYWVSTLSYQDDKDYVLVSCNDGNLYLQKKDTQQQLRWEITCMTLFEGYDDVVLSAPGGGVLHYYDNTMSKIGVSRLRSDDRGHLPKSSVYVSLVNFESDGLSLLAAVDDKKNIFFPVVCTHVGRDEPPKIYLVGTDIDAGIATLKEKQTENTVTNGPIDKCTVLKLGITARQGGAWATTDDDAEANYQQNPLTVEFDDSVVGGDGELELPERDARIEDKEGDLDYRDALSDVNRFSEQEEEAADMENEVALELSMEEAQRARAEADDGA